MLTWAVVFFGIAMAARFFDWVAPRRIAPGVGVPPAPTALEIASGLGATLATGSLMLAASFVLGELRGPFTPFGLVLAVLVGAVIACGERGRARLWALLVVSNFRYLGSGSGIGGGFGGQWYLVTDEKSRRLREVGAAQVLVRFLLGGAIAMVLVGLSLWLASFVVPAPGPTAPPLDPELLRHLAESDDPAARAFAASVAAPARPPPALSDSLIPWLSNASVLALLACASLFTPGGRVLASKPSP